MQFVNKEDESEFERLLLKMRPKTLPALPPVTWFGKWSQPESAPKDGTQILCDFGYPWLQIAAWNTYDGKWATANMGAQGMDNGTTDIWFETELEDAKQLKRWTPLPTAKIRHRRRNQKVKL
jgi:hypothetical protein